MVQSPKQQILSTTITVHAMSYDCCLEDLFAAPRFEYLDYMYLAAQNGRTFARGDAMNPCHAAYSICLCGGRRLPDCRIKKCCGLESRGDCHHIQFEKIRQDMEAEFLLKEAAVRRNERQIVLSLIDTVLEPVKTSQGKIYDLSIDMDMCLDVLAQIEGIIAKETNTHSCAKS